MLDKEHYIDYDEIVDGRDARNLSDKITHSGDAAHRAESCGCPNCKKEAISSRRAEQAYVETVLRKPKIDHEEDWIIHLAYSKVFRNE